MTSSQTWLAPARARVAAALAIALVFALAFADAGMRAPAAAAAAPAAGGIALSALQVEKKHEPVGIDVEKPRFSWVIASEERGVVQESYRLRISATSGEAWSYDSGVVESIESANVEYLGAMLPSASQFDWSVDVVSNVGPASASASFSTGLYDQADWAGSQWIGNDRVAESVESELDLGGSEWISPVYTGGNTSSGYFRKTFTLDSSKVVASAEFALTADKGFSAFLNGVQIASASMESDQWKRAQRVAVNPLAGSNILAVRFDNAAKPFGAIVGKLIVVYTDGTSQEIVTDASWLSTDAAAVKTGWHVNGYDTSSWVAPSVRAAFGEGPWGGQVTVPAGAKPDTGMNFDTASWIVPAIGEPSSSNPIPSALFRRSIDVSSSKTVAWAQLAVTGDQSVNAYWNGNKIATVPSTNNAWQTARVANLDVRAGENVVAFALGTSGNSSNGGVLARVRIGFTDGTSIDYVTNSGTRSLVSTEVNAPTGWNDTGFNDSGWVNANARYLYRGGVYGARVKIPALSVSDAALTFDGVEWIWSQEESTGQAPGEPRAFRFTHESPAGKTAVKADILITADDSFKLWANGSLLGATDGSSNGWQQSHRFTADLAADENVFAVLATNGAGSPAGLIVNARIAYSDGTSELITSGSNWKVSKTIVDDFFTAGFNDSGWEQAVIQAVYGSGPWGSGVKPPAVTPAAAPVLRKGFTVDGDVANATIFYSAGGYADVSLNGEPISDAMLAPGFTDYDDTVQYVATDVTAQLESGANALGMELGRGFYGMTGANVWNWENPPWHDEPVVRAVLRIEYSDGSIQNVVTDESWTIHDGPTVFDDLYGGEKYDANRELPGYDIAGYDDAGWANASAVRGPSGELVNQRQQPIRVTEELPATDVTLAAPDTYVVKFPRVLAGNVQITAEGPVGTTVRFQYGEKLRTSGLVNFDNNGGFASGFQTDYFTLAGTGEPESWEARFSYKGFQYIQVTGWPAGSTPSVENFTAKVVHTDAAEVGTFESSSDIMNRVHRATVDTLLNNIHGIPTDTPMFEKNGWTGDAAVGAEMFLMNLDTHELFAKWMRDLDETRDAEGAPLVIAPSSGQWGAWGVAPTWHSAYVNIPRWLNQYGGDDRVMTELYGNMKQYVDLEFNRSPGGIANTRLADWVAPEASPAGGNAPEDSRVSATAFLYNMLLSMEKTATYLGHDADAVQFAANAVVVKNAFNAAFLDAEHGLYRGTGDRGYRQTHNVLALAFGLAPDAAMQQRVADSIAADVVARGNTLNTGVLGTKYLLPVLTDNGYSSLAYKLAVQTAYPSWGYIVENGGTSMWEHWSLDARSLGHYFLGTVEDWFFHDVGGIEANDVTGYRDIEIKPAVTSEMDWAKTSLSTPFGPVSSNWVSDVSGGLTLDVSVPVGSQATVHLPADNAWAASEGGLPLERVDGVTAVTLVNGQVIVTVGSGQYSFSVDPELAAIGTVITLFDNAIAHVAELKDTGDINAVQAQRLREPLGVGRADALLSLAALRSDDTVAAAEHLADALTPLTAFDAVVAAVDTDESTLGTLRDTASDLRVEVYHAVNTLLELVPSVQFAEAGYRPGEAAEATVSLSNNGLAELTHVTGQLALPGVEWGIDPADAVELSALLAAGDTATGSAIVSGPQDALPADHATVASFSYEFAGATISLDASGVLVIDSPLVMDSLVVTPTEAEPGSVVEVAAVLRNDGTTPVSGRLELSLPQGWQLSLPSEEIVVPAGGTADVTVAAFVSRDTDAASQTVSIGATFTRDGATLASGEASLTVQLGTLPTVEDPRHIDLGEAVDEAAHNLSASASSGSNSEAGLTRRYAGHLTPFSYFEFDMEVSVGEPFVVRTVETYDRAQQKKYKIYVDDEEVFLRLSDHKGGGGTETFEFVVDAEHATSDTVRIKFENQDNAAYYDPSIADVWTLPLGADVNAPQLRASFDPASPNLLTGWYQEQGVGVELEASDDRGVADIEYRLGTDSFAIYSDGFEISGDGEHALEYRANDAAGNVVTKAHTVLIDATPPETTALVAEATANTTAVAPSTVTLTATDATSGIGSTQLRVNDGEWVVTESIVLERVGDYRVEYFSTDNAGNAEAVQALDVTVENADDGGQNPGDGDGDGGHNPGDGDGGGDGGQNPGGGSDGDNGSPGSNNDGGNGANDETLSSTGVEPWGWAAGGATLLMIAFGLMFIARRRTIENSED